MKKLRCRSCKSKDNVANPVTKECQECGVSICLACWIQHCTLCLGCAKKKVQEAKRHLEEVRKRYDA